MSQQTEIFKVEGVKNTKNKYKTRKLNNNVINGSVEIRLVYPDSDITRHFNNNEINTIFKSEIQEHVIIDSHEDRADINTMINILDNFDVTMDMDVCFGEFATLRAIKITITNITR